MALRHARPHKSTARYRGGPRAHDLVDLDFKHALEHGRVVGEPELYFLLRTPDAVDLALCRDRLQEALIIEKHDGVHVVVSSFDVIVGLVLAILILITVFTTIVIERF